MGLGTHTIKTWDEMKNVFLEKYKDYCMPHNLKDEAFKIMQKEDENMEDFVERFKYNLHRSTHSDMDKDILKIIFYGH